MHRRGTLCAPCGSASGAGPRRTVTGGGGGGMAARAPPPATPTHIRGVFLGNKNEIYQRGPTLEGNFRYTNFSFLASAPPPRGGGGGYRSRSPLRRGLSQRQQSSPQKNGPARYYSGIAQEWPSCQRPHRKGRGPAPHHRQPQGQRAPGDALVVRGVTPVGARRGSACHNDAAAAAVGLTFHRDTQEIGGPLPLPRDAQL